MGGAMLRHLLLALFLIGLSLPAMALPAQGQSAPVDCHGTQPTHKPDGNAGKVGHFCIGCVANPALPAAEAPLPLPPAAPVAQPMTALAGANAPPSTPPPRT
jgi:hypothetical protein